jgi:hypothetical protein
MSGVPLKNVLHSPGQLSLSMFAMSVQTVGRDVSVKFDGGGLGVLVSSTAYCSLC